MNVNDAQKTAISDLLKKEEPNVRKRRAIIYDDDPDVANMLKEHFMLRGYEVLMHQKPVNCPAYDDIRVCKERYPCADIILVDMNLPRMSGIEMLRVQSLNGCKVPAGSKAVMSGDIDEREQRDIEELGCAFFQKPFSLNEISTWLNEREKQMDLSQPLGMRRKEKRAEANEVMKCLVAGHDELVEGIVLNRSPLGLCLKIKYPVRQGQTIAVRSGLSPSCRVASVQWVRATGDGSYMAGLKYA